MAKKQLLGKTFTPKNVPLKKLLVFAIGLNLVVVLSVILLQSRLPPEVPLFYGLAEGQEQLSSSISLVLPPVLSLAIIFVNFALSFVTESYLLKNFLVATSVASSLLSTTTVIKIIFLVASF